MRRLLTFPCAGETLVGTLDEAAIGMGGTTGLLIVTGGNEVRAGAHRGMALLAARLAAAGTPVFRFDRRGVGDSSGENGGYAASAADLLAAAAAFKQAAPHVERLVGFGNCDAASALALFGRAAGIDAVLLANPWVVATTDLPPAAAIRRRYAERLLDPAAWWRLATGRVNLGKLAGGLRRVAIPEPRALADRVVAAIAGWGDAARVLLAEGDATAIAFADAARARRLPTASERVATASHSFARPADAAALEAWVRRGLEQGDGPGTSD